MKGKIVAIRHNGIPFVSNKNARLILTGIMHHYILLK